MNRQPVTGRRLRQIVENTGYRYSAAFESATSPLVLAIKTPGANALAVPGWWNADWVKTDEQPMRVWPAVRNGITRRNELEITRDPAAN